MMKKGIGMMLLASVLCAGTFLASQTDEFTFRNGITWGMSKAEVIGTEGVASSNEDEMDLPDGSKMSFLEIEDVTAAGFGADAEFIFIDDALVCCGYEFEDETDRDKLLKSLEAKYGQSSPVDWEVVFTLTMPLGGDMTYLQNTDFSCEWDVSDDLYMMMYDDDGEIDVVYLDRAAMLAMSEEESLESVTEAATEEINTEGL